MTVAGDKLKEVSTGAVTVRVPDALAPLAVPVIVAVWFVATATVVTVNVCVAAPDATVTLAGTVAAPLLLDSATTKPAAGAAELIVTVPVLTAPPRTLAGLSVRLVGAGA